MNTLELNNLPSPVLLVWGLPEGSINPVASMGYLSAKVPNLANYCHVDTMADPVKLQKWLDTHKEEDDYKQEIWKIPEGEWKLIGRLDNFSDAELDRGILNEGYYVINPFQPPIKNDYMPDDNFTKTQEKEYWKDYKKYKSTQSKTLPANTLVFKKS